MATTGTLFIISAPSGAGKTSLVNAVLNELANIMVSISYTTRPKRALEQHGKHYYFVDEPTFQDLIKQDMFLEYANVFGNFYGTSKSWLANELTKGNDVILEIDWQGACQVREKVANAISIFILPPSLAVLQARLINRQQDSNTVIATRLAQAKADISHYTEYDYVIINDSFAAAAADLIAIIRARRISIASKYNGLQDLVAKMIS